MTLMSAVKWTVDWREGGGNLPPEYVEKLMRLCYVKLSHNWQSGTTVWMVVLNLLKCVYVMVLIDIHCFTIYTLLSLSLCIFVCLSVSVSACLSVCRFVCLSVRPSFCLSVCLSVCMSCHLLVIQRWHTFSAYIWHPQTFSISWLLLFTSYILVVSNGLDVFT